MKDGSFDSMTPDVTKGKNAMDTNLMTPGAREPYNSGKDDMNEAGKRTMDRHKPFGKLGVKGFAES